MFPKPTKKKKQTTTKIRKEVETLAKRIAKERAGWICQRCHKKVEGSNAHGSHIIPVSHGNVLRFDPMNILCLCYHCHINFFHKNPLDAVAWLQESFPERIEYVNSKKNNIVKFSYEDYVQMKMDLTAVLNS